MRVSKVPAEAVFLVLFAFVWGSVLALSVYTSTFVVLRPVMITSDAKDYVDLGVSLAEHGTYALDGQPFADREPGYSTFLAPLFFLTGGVHPIVIYIAQAVLFAAVAFFFVKTLAKAQMLSRRSSLFLFSLLLFFPGVFHILFSLNRESIALSLAMLLTAFCIRLKERGSKVDAILAGAALGGLILTYASFLLFPLFLLPVLFFWKVRGRMILTLIVMAGVFVGAWGMRNVTQVGCFCLNGRYRPAAVWYVRGEQAEHLRGLDPLRCLLAEYVTRDWNGLPPQCSFNAVKNTKWPEGIKHDPAVSAIGREGQRKILHNFMNYLWFSVFEVVELHFPYVNGWGLWYNILAVLGSAVLYLGALLGIPTIFRRRDLLLFFAFIAYVTGVFILTDATPRYLMPVIFCYAVLAALGYDRFLSRLWHR